MKPAPVADPETLQEAVEYFSDPDRTHDYMVRQRWPNGVTCPTCGSAKVGFISTRRVYECRNAENKHPKRQFTAKKGTIFEDSPLPLKHWMLATWMLVNCKNGVSSYEIARAIGVTQKATWHMLHRIRLAMQAADGGKLAGEIEIDETFIGGRARYMHADKREKAIKGRGPMGKMAVMGLLQRHDGKGKSRVKLSVVETRRRHELMSRQQYSRLTKKRPSRGVADYFPFLFEGGKGVVVILSAYFDESVREEKDAPLCVGGYVFKPAQYTRFRQRWQREVLKLPDKSRLRHFHMTDLCAGQGVYKGLRLPVRIGILERAVQVIEQQTYAAIATYFDQAEFIREAPNDWPEYRGSVYSAACQMCVQTTGYWLRDWGVHLNVLYVFERGHKFQGEADDMMKAIAASHDACSHFHYRNHLFEEKDNEVGLQAADLFAWTITKASIADPHQLPPAMKPFIPLMFKLAHINAERTKINQMTGDRLKRFIHENVWLADPGRTIPVAFGNRRRAFK